MLKLFFPFSFLSSFVYLLNLQISVTMRVRNMKVSIYHIRCLLWSIEVTMLWFGVHLEAYYHIFENIRSNSRLFLSIIPFYLIFIIYYFFVHFLFYFLFCLEHFSLGNWKKWKPLTNQLNTFISSHTFRHSKTTQSNTQIDIHMRFVNAKQTLRL